MSARQLTKAAGNFQSEDIAHDIKKTAKPWGFAVLYRSAGSAAQRLTYPQPSGHRPIASGNHSAASVVGAALAPPAKLGFSSSNTAASASLATGLCPSRKAISVPSSRMKASVRTAPAALSA